MDWTAGYVADIGYTFGYYAELNPLRLKLAFLSAGLVAPEVGAACELGFGQGVSVNVHAAASVTEWSGTDFNPTQAGYAQELNAASESHARLYDESFSEFCTRTDLPDFDYIGLHGIWSWISDENRRIIVDFIRRKLKVGGVVYISYNAQPGWAASGPLRHLLSLHADSMAATGTGITARIENALSFASRLSEINPMYLSKNPAVKTRLDGIKDQNRNYLAHEFFNRDWHPMHFSTMNDWLSSAKLSFACTANYSMHIDGIQLTAEQRILLQEITDPVFRETVRDYIHNTQFRKDYWVKGPRRLSNLDRAEELRKHRIMLVVPADQVSRRFKSNGLGEVEFSDDVYGPLVKELADHKPHSIGQLEKTLGEKVKLNQILEAALLLGELNQVVSVQDDRVTAKARARTDKLNAHLLHRERSNDEAHVLASPVSGGGVAVNRIEQFFLLARQQDRKTSEQWAEMTFNHLRNLGMKVMQKGEQIESPEESLAVLRKQAEEFRTNRLPILQALGITS